MGLWPIDLTATLVYADWAHRSGEVNVVWDRPPSDGMERQDSVLLPSEIVPRAPVRSTRVDEAHGTESAPRTR